MCAQPIAIDRGGGDREDREPGPVEAGASATPSAATSASAIPTSHGPSHSARSDHHGAPRSRSLRPATSARPITASIERHDPPPRERDPRDHERRDQVRDAVDQPEREHPDLRPRRRQEPATDGADRDPAEQASHAGQDPPGVEPQVVGQRRGDEPRRKERQQQRGAGQRGRQGRGAAPAPGARTRMNAPGAPLRRRRSRRGRAARGRPASPRRRRSRGTPSTGQIGGAAIAIGRAAPPARARRSTPNHASA
jgi:hypothetical protein